MAHSLTSLSMFIKPYLPARPPKAQHFPSHLIHPLRLILNHTNHLTICPPWTGASYFDSSIFALDLCSFKAKPIAHVTFTKPHLPARASHHFIPDSAFTSYSSQPRPTDHLPTLTWCELSNPSYSKSDPGLPIPHFRRTAAITTS